MGSRETVPTGINVEIFTHRVGSTGAPARRTVFIRGTIIIQLNYVIISFEIYVFFHTSRLQHYNEN
jgi:hypothetical protein